MNPETMPAEQARQTLLIEHGMLIDGTGAAPVEDASIVIQDGRIAAVGPSRTVDRPDGPVERIDARGRWILPGLIDCHVHICMRGLPYRDHLTVADRALAAAINVRTFLETGVTTVRDVGGVDYAEFNVRRAVNAGVLPGPRMILAGRLLSITTSGADAYPGMYEEADGPDAVRHAARLQLKRGADLIKLMATGAVLGPGEKPDSIQYSREELAAGIDEAHKVGKRTAVHGHGARGIANAVAAGADSIEHGTMLCESPETARAMADHGVFLVPTLKVVDDILEGRHLDIPSGVSHMPDSIRKAKEVARFHTRSVQLAAELGIPIAMGTDTVPGDTALELVLMHRAGLTPMQCIVASTKTAAECCAIADIAGTLTPGKAADLLVIAGNPLDNLNVLRQRDNIALVMKAGQVAARHGRVV